MMKVQEQALLHAFIQTHPAAAARALETQAPKAAAEFIATLPEDQSRQILAQILPGQGALLCAELPASKAALILSDLSVEFVVALLRCMPQPQRARLLNALPDRLSPMCRLLLSYPEDTVGARMKVDILMLPLNVNVNEARQRLALHKGHIDCDALPVVDHKRHVAGTLSAQMLLAASGETPIKRLLNEHAPFLMSRASLLSASQQHAWRQNDTMLVLNRQRQLVGFLRHVDLRASLENAPEHRPSTLQGETLVDFGRAYLSALGASLDALGVGRSSDSAPGGKP